MITVIAVNIGYLIGGTVVVETVFQIPGLGSLLVQSALQRDYTLVTALTLMPALQSWRLASLRTSSTPCSILASGWAEDGRRPGHPMLQRRRLSLGPRSFGERLGLVGAIILVVIVAAALLAPLIAPYAPNRLNILQSLQAPSWAHLMGTDDVGRDVFSRVLYGVRLDILVVLFVTYAPLPIGVILGTVAGYFRGVTDGIISRFIDVLIAFPFLVLVIAVVAIIGPGVYGAIVGIIVGGWAIYARLARGEMLVLRERSSCSRRRRSGTPTRARCCATRFRTCCARAWSSPPSDIVINLLLLAGLSFLGLGVQPPTAELGAIVASGQPYLLSAWWIATLPGLVLVLIGVAVSMVGDAIGDRWGIGNG